MKAVEVEENTLALIDVPKPEPEPGEVLIKVMATAINRADLAQRNGLIPSTSRRKPYYGLRV